MSEQPWGGSLPPEVKDAIDDIFPGSEERRRIAYTLMFYNHKPNGDEMKKLAEVSGRSLRTAQEVVRILSENNLFTTELGSVPLYKHIHSMGVSKTLQGFGDAKPTDEDAQASGGIEGEDEQPETPMLEDGDEDPDEDMDAEVEAVKARARQPSGPIARAMPSVLAVEQLRDSFTKMSQRQDMLEVTLDKGFKEILTRLRKQDEVPTPVVAANPLTVDPLEEEEVETEPVKREEPAAKGEEDLGPFAGLSKRAIVDMAMNDPDGIHAMVRGYSRGDRTIMATPETMRWMGVMLSTYTQSAFERSISDGYEGTLSDFLNDCVYMYFADRGKVLQWADMPQPGQMPFPKRRMS